MVGGSSGAWRRLVVCCCACAWVGAEPCLFSGAFRSLSHLLGAKREGDAGKGKKYSASDAAVLCTYAPMGVRFSMGTPSPSLPPAEAGGSDDSQCLPAPPPALTRASPLSVAARSRSGVPVTKPQMGSTRNPGCRLLLRLDADSLCVFPSSCAPPSPPPSPPARPKLHPLLALAKRGMNGDRVRKGGFR